LKCTYRSRQHDRMFRNRVSKQKQKCKKRVIITQEKGGRKRRQLYYLSYIVSAQKNRQSSSCMKRRRSIIIITDEHKMIKITASFWNPVRFLHPSRGLCSAALSYAYKGHTALRKKEKSPQFVRNRYHDIKTSVGTHKATKSRT